MLKLDVVTGCRELWLVSFCRHNAWCLSGLWKQQHRCMLGCFPHRERWLRLWPFNEQFQTCFSCTPELYLSMSPAALWFFLFVSVLQRWLLNCSPRSTGRRTSSRFCGFRSSRSVYYLCEELVLKGPVRGSAGGTERHIYNRIKERLKNSCRNKTDTQSQSKYISNSFIHHHFIWLLFILLNVSLCNVHHHFKII